MMSTAGQVKNLLDYGVILEKKLDIKLKVSFFKNYSQQYISNY